jgi:hypothetical protein
VAIAPLINTLAAAPSFPAGAMNAATGRKKSDMHVADIDMSFREPTHCAPGAK